MLSSAPRSHNRAAGPNTLPPRTGIADRCGGVDHAHFEPPPPPNQARCSLPLTVDCRPLPGNPAWILPWRDHQHLIEITRSFFSLLVVSVSLRLMSGHAMEGTGSAAGPSLSQGPEALPPGDSSSPSSGFDGFTPESSSGDSSNEALEQKDPFFSSSSHNDGSDDDEVYELNERGSREINGAEGSLRHGFTYTAEEERAVIDKFDRRLVLFVAFLYMLSFLDRSSLSYLPFPSCSLRPYALSGRVWLVPESRSWFLPQPSPQGMSPSHPICRGGLKV